MFPTDHDFRRYAVAQATAKRVATQIAQQIEPGMTEADAYELAGESFHRESIRRHWHSPVIGIGEGTLKLRSLGALAHARITRGRRYAASGDAVMIDIAPVVDGYPSDFTWSGALGTPSATAMAAAAHKFAQSVVGQLANTDVGSNIWRSAEGLDSTDSGVRGIPVPVIGLGHRLMRIPIAWLHWSGARYLYLALTRGPADGARGRQRAPGSRSRQRRAHMAGYPEGALMSSSTLVAAVNALMLKRTQLEGINRKPAAGTATSRCAQPATERHHALQATDPGCPTGKIAARDVRIFLARDVREPQDVRPRQEAGAWH